MKVITISVPDDVLQAIEQESTAAGMNRSQFIVDRISAVLKVPTGEKARELACELFQQIIDKIFLRGVVLASEKRKEGLEPNPGMLMTDLGLDDVRVPLQIEVDPDCDRAPVVATRRRPFKRAKKSGAVSEAAAFVDRVLSPDDLS